MVMFKGNSHDIFHNKKKWAQFINKPKKLKDQRPSGIVFSVLANHAESLARWAAEHGINFTPGQVADSVPPQTPNVAERQSGIAKIVTK